MPNTQLRPTTNNQCNPTKQQTGDTSSISSETDDIHNTSATDSLSAYIDNFEDERYVCVVVLHILRPARID